MKKSILVPVKRHGLLSCYLILAICASGQSFPTASPEEAGLSSERLQRIAKVIEQHIGNNRIAGAVTMVCRKGRLVWYESHGLMNPDQR